MAMRQNLAYIPASPSGAGRRCGVRLPSTCTQRSTVQRARTGAAVTAPASYLRFVRVAGFTVNLASKSRRRRLAGGRPARPCQSRGRVGPPRLTPPGRRARAHIDLHKPDCRSGIRQRLRCVAGAAGAHGGCSCRRCAVGHRAVPSWSSSFRFCCLASRVAQRVGDATRKTWGKRCARLKRRM